MKIFIRAGKSLAPPIPIDIQVVNSPVINRIKARVNRPIKTQLPWRWRTQYFIERNINSIQEKIIKIYRFYFGEHRSTLRDRYEFLTQAGGKCINCGFSDMRALQIDHVKSDGGSERKNFRSKSGSVYWKIVLKSIQANEEKYQILCANCNWIKRETHNELHRLRL